MSRWGRGRSAEPGAGGVPELPEEHRFAIAVDAEAPELVLALRAHPRNRWTEAAIVRGTPPGAPDRAVDGNVFNAGYDNHPVMEIAEITRGVVGPDAFTASGVSPEQRPEQLGIEAWGALAAAVAAERA